jgi:hypothetical protein
MYLLIRYPGGIIVEGVMLAKGTNRLRVAVAGFPDTIELKRAGAPTQRPWARRWRSDSGSRNQLFPPAPPCLN